MNKGYKFVSNGQVSAIAWLDKKKRLQCIPKEYKEHLYQAHCGANDSQIFDDIKNTRSGYIEIHAIRVDDDGKEVT